jgi:hypothetical protein
MTNLHWDTSEVDRLAVDLSEAPGRLQRKAPAVFARGAFEIKGRIKRAASGHSHLPSLDNHVSYDRLGLLEYEIGFDKIGQGNLANIAVYGSINNAPIMPSPAELARLELPEIERHLGDVGEEAVLGGDSQ